MKIKAIAPSKLSAIKTIYAAFNILDKNGGELQGKKVIEQIRSSEQFSEWELEILEKTGATRWVSILQFYTIDCTKAGFLRKDKGIWFLTSEGKEAITLGAEMLFDTINKSYRQWAKENKNKDSAPEDIETLESQKAYIDTLEEQAIAGIKDFIKSKNAYDFQDMVAALLRAMGYFTPFVSPKGKDGGLDIIAYSDPLGATSPRLKVQVKHTPDNSVSVDVIRSLTGLLNKDGDVGLLVTSGSFTSESEKTARESHRHIKLLNGGDFIELWQRFYSKMPDEDKNRLPLHPIYFLAGNE